MTDKEKLKQIKKALPEVDTIHHDIELCRLVEKIKKLLDNQHTIK